jgi:hypothetical protein
MSIINTMLGKKNYIWTIWTLVISIIFFIHLITLTISPTIWQDEVQIIDYGRVFLNPNTDWSVSWLTQSDSPSYSLSYLGCLLQETVYRLTHSPFGPRLASLVGAILAATISLGWLLSRKTPKLIAFLTSLVFFIDPVFVSSYRGARVDSWAMAFCLASCWLLRNSHKTIENNHRKSGLIIIVSGSLAGISLFIWPSSIILIPLVFLEVFDLTKCQKKEAIDRFNLIKLTIYFLLGISLACVFLSIPILDNIEFILSNLFKITKSDSALTNQGNTFNLYLLKVALLLNPFVLPITLIGVFFVRSSLLKVVVLFVFAFALATRPYSQRLIYLLPYFMVVVSNLSISNSTYDLNQSLRRYIKPILILLLAWSIVISMGYRSMIALSQVQGREPHLIEQMARDSIGPGSYKVVAPYTFYYAGRSLGWKIRYPAPYLSTLMDTKLLSEVDFFIVDRDSENKLHGDLNSAGFKKQKTVGGSIQGEQNKLFFGGKPFGEYAVYSRDIDSIEN